MLIQKLRLKQGWSQQQLAEASGLSTRTIQRIEAGHPASVETLKSIAAVFEVDFASLSPTPPESPTMSVSPTARTEKNDLRGNTDFWSESIDLKLTRAGYTKQADKEVTTARGLKGRQLRYAVERRGREHRYWVTVFLKDDRVVLVEAAGDSEHFGAAEATVERSIATLRVD